MNDAPPPTVAATPVPLPTPPAPAAPRPLPPPPRRRESMFGCLLTLSLTLNLLAGVVLLAGCLGLFLAGRTESSGEHLTEQHFSGETGATDKVAIISLDGVILEGLLSFVHKQIEQAGKDKHVKAVVLRINSPGGSITASDELHRRLTELRDGNPKKQISPRPLVVSMGSMAASGGYYVAMPAQTIYAERTTMTGSIGVYISFPNLSELGEKIGFSLITIKQGQIKDSASPFKNMTPQERQVWQDMVNESYGQFLRVVEQGRPALANGQLLAPRKITPVAAGPDFLRKDGERPQPYTRYLADGGVWTAEKAVQYQLIDKIGSLEDAVGAAAGLANGGAGLGEHFRAIKYERPKSLADLFGLSLSSGSAQPGSLLDPARLQAGLMPRLWYLAPGAEASGFLAAAAK